MIRKRRITAGLFLKKFEVGKKFLVIIFVVAALGGLFWCWWAKAPACRESCAWRVFVVKKGETLSRVAQRLEEQGLIRSPLFFQIEASRQKVVRRIQAGDFRLSPGMTPDQIAQELTHGTLDRWVTIVEGLRREEIAEKLEEALSGEDSRFSKEEFLEKTAKLEGKLFPDTYLLPKNATASQAVSILNLNFEKKTAGLSLAEENLVLASLVEREARREEDRPIVAGIIFKRLKAFWPLQVDATVQYAKASQECHLHKGCQWWPANLTKEDLKIVSAYNTYLYQGLPPAPICNPSLSSLKAARDPVVTNFWYYLSDREGKIHYAATIEEHNLNIQKYLR